MNTLIRIVYTKKASEEPELFFLNHRVYGRFFRRCSVVSQDMVNERFVVLVSVKRPENKVSEFCLGSFSRHPSISRVKIVS